MARKRKGARVLGPYFDRSKSRWFYWLVDADGQRVRATCPRDFSEEEAQWEVDQQRAAIELPEVESAEDALELYCQHLEALQDKPRTIRWHRDACKRLLDLHGDSDIWTLRHADLEEVLNELSDLSMSTQRSYWMAVERMCSWWAIRGLTTGDLAKRLQESRVRRSLPMPWQTRSGSRRLGRGAPQLRNMSEARRYARAVLAMERTDYRVAGLLPIATGLNSGETLHLRGCDIDLKGEAIYMGDDHVGWTVKRDSRLRSVPIPPQIHDDLQELTWEAGPRGYLFHQFEDGKPVLDTPRDRSWLRRVVRLACEAAGVQRVSPQGLRGTWSTMLAEVKRRDIADIGHALGHADRGETARRHYVGAVPEGALLRLVEEDD